ncbi:hypothetical protein F4805DRAFT_452691 [Annulohypoxylon moriforme]|nr:hypothetical protein F4805DRAFT_452691 [Annulohypoxylon moriforme]
MSSSREVIFSVKPPMFIQVDKLFPVIIEGPDDKHHGRIGALALFSTETSEFCNEFLEFASGYNATNAWGNGRNPNMQSMEFKMKITQEGNYYISIQLYNEPADGTVKLVEIVKSLTFFVLPKPGE